MLFMDEEMPVAWSDGTVNFTEDDLSISYTLEDDVLTLDMLESVLVFRKGEKPVATEPPVVSEMEQAGFTDFMEVGVPYAYTTVCSKDETKTTTGELTVTSYEIFEDAEGYAPLEGYEWRVVTVEARFFDDNAWDYGISRPGTNSEDYYNVKLHDDTIEMVEETDTYYQSRYTIIHNGQETDAYSFYNYGSWSGWSTDEAGNHESTYTQTWDFLVPIGYDGCVVGFRSLRVEWPDDAYITDLNPDDFLLFRLN
jgi:hypothetical protein